MVDYIKNGIWEKRMPFSALICAIILVAMFYIYCISSVVVETVNRNQNFKNLQIVQNEYQNIEKNYLGLITKFNLDYAYSLGFVGGNPLAYIPRQIPVAQNSVYAQTLR